MSRISRESSVEDVDNFFLERNLPAQNVNGDQLFRYTRADLSAIGDDGKIYKRVKKIKKEEAVEQLQENNNRLKADNDRLQADNDRLQVMVKDVNYSLYYFVYLI